MKWCDRQTHRQTQLFIVRGCYICINIQSCLYIKLSIPLSVSQSQCVQSSMFNRQSVWVCENYVVRVFCILFESEVWIQLLIAGVTKVARWGSQWPGLTLTATSQHQEYSIKSSPRLEDFIEKGVLVLMLDFILPCRYLLSKIMCFYWQNISVCNGSWCS